MTDDEILGRLSQILRDLLGNDSIVLESHTTRPDVPGWDSFGYLSFIVAVEMEFSIKLGLADIESFANVGAVVTAIQEQMTGRT